MTLFNIVRDNWTYNLYYVRMHLFSVKLKYSNIVLHGVYWFSYSAKDDVAI